MGMPSLWNWELILMGIQIYGEYLMIFGNNMEKLGKWIDALTRKQTVDQLFHEFNLLVVVNNLYEAHPPISFFWTCNPWDCIIVTLM
jgi:hypothetical protein